MFVQATQCTHGKSSYLTYLVRESFRTPQGPRSRTICNITALTPHPRDWLPQSLPAPHSVPPDHLQHHRSAPAHTRFDRSVPARATLHRSRPFTADSGLEFRRIGRSAPSLASLGIRPAL